MCEDKLEKEKGLEKKKKMNCKEKKEKKIRKRIGPYEARTHDPRVISTMLCRLS